MNCAIILAGGIGSRVGASIPKQFIEVDGKPVIIYTLENFERHPEISFYIVVCIDGFQNILYELAKEYNLQKLKKVVIGGETFQESAYNGLIALQSLLHNEDDIVVLHQAASPLAGEDLISDCIRVAKRTGNAFSAKPVSDYSFFTESGVSSSKYINRDNIKLLTHPSAHHYQEILSIYNQSFSKGLGKEGYPGTLYIDSGYPVYFSKYSPFNIKITTKEDIELFKAIIKIKGEGIETCKDI